MPRNPAVYSTAFALFQELGTGSFTAGPVVPEGHVYVVVDVEAFQGGSTSEFVNCSVGYLEMVDDEPFYIPVIGLEAPVELLYPASAHWEGRVVFAPGTQIAAENYTVTGGPNVYVGGYDLLLP